MFHFLRLPCGSENIQYRGPILISFAAHQLLLKAEKVIKSTLPVLSLFLVCGGRRRRRPLNTQSGILPAVYFCHGPSFILLPASDLQQGKAKGQENNKINSDVVINIGLYHLHRRQYVDRVFCKSKMIYTTIPAVNFKRGMLNNFSTEVGQQIS